MAAVGKKASRFGAGHTDLDDKEHLWNRGADSRGC